MQHGLQNWEQNILYYSDLSVVQSSGVSQPINVIEMPRPDKVQAEYLYFQFTADEDTNDTGVTAVDIGFSAGDEPFWPAGTDVETKSSDVGGFGGYDEVSMDFEALKQMVPRAVKLQIGATQFNINSELITDDGNSLSYDETELNENSFDHS